MYKIQTHYSSFAAPYHSWGPHLVPHLEQAAVKWGPVWELLAGLVETAKAWSSLASMTLARLFVSGEHAWLLLPLLPGGWERKGET